MTTYPFDIQLVVDPFNPENVVTNGQVYIYATSDIANASPLPLTDVNGVPITNPIMSNSNGFLPAFSATLPQVKWSSGGFSGYFSSYQGMLEEVRAALLAAQEAIANSAFPAGGTTGQVLSKLSPANGHTGWSSPIVVIGPEDPWPTSLPTGTLVVRTET